MVFSDTESTVAACFGVRNSGSVLIVIGGCEMGMTTILSGHKECAHEPKHTRASSRGVPDLGRRLMFRKALGASPSAGRGPCRMCCVR